MLELFFHASLLIRFVLLVLAVFSVISWSIILYKWAHLQIASSESQRMLAALEGQTDHDLGGLLKSAEALRVSPLAALVKSLGEGPKRRSAEEARLALKNCQAQQIEQLESHLIFLATTGSTAPFIGLLGTVWGIMDAFKGIGAAGSASLAVVAPAIAEALVTTAAGLAAAIPAVMAYNFFLNWIRKLTNIGETFTEALQSRFIGRPA